MYKINLKSKAQMRRDRLTMIVAIVAAIALGAPLLGMFALVVFPALAAAVTVPAFYMATGACLFVAVTAIVAGLNI